jgi:hypothetical protein
VAVTVKSRVFWVGSTVQFGDIPILQRNISCTSSGSKSYVKQETWNGIASSASAVYVLSLLLKSAAYSPET